MFGLTPEQWNEMNEYWQRKRFDLSARMPISWKSRAFTLKRAADHLYTIASQADERFLMRQVEEYKVKKAPGKSDESRQLEGEELEDFLDSQLTTPYFLLMGYAIENLLKLILLIRHPEFITPQGELRGVKTHDLVALNDRCDMTATEKEIALLHRLSRTIKWQGKYPVPLKSSEFWPQKQPDGSWKDGEWVSAPEMKRKKEALDSLFDKLWEEIERIDASRDHAARDNTISEE